MYRRFVSHISITARLALVLGISFGLFQYWRYAKENTQGKFNQQNQSMAEQKLELKNANQSLTEADRNSVVSIDNDDEEARIELADLAMVSGAGDDDSVIAKNTDAQSDVDARQALYVQEETSKYYKHSVVFGKVFQKTNDLLAKVNALPTRGSQVSEIRNLIKMIDAERATTNRQVSGEEIELDLLKQGLLYITELKNFKPENCTHAEQKFLSAFSPRYQTSFEFQGTKLAYQMLQKICPPKQESI